MATGDESVVYYCQRSHDEMGLRREVNTDPCGWI